VPEDQNNETASTPTETSTSANKKTVSGPGVRLTTAREARHMGVEQVAAQLRLDGNVIRALEADDYAALPSATFVKGYLRSYGRMLGLDVEVLVAEYQAVAGAEEVQLRVPEKPAADGSSINKWFWLTVVVVAVLLLAWYWSKPGEQPVSTDTLTSSNALISAPEALAEALPAGEPLLASKVVAEEQDDTVGNDPVIEQLLLGLQDPVPAQADAAPEAVTTDSGQDVEPAPVPADDASSSPAPKSVSEVAAADLITITLIGQQDSWVSIKDAREKRVFRDLLKPGERREISGAAPLLVHLGFAPGVKVIFAGQEYNHSRWHKSNSTARFTLPSQ